MKKTPTIFLRNPDSMKAIIPQPHPDCDWVFAGEGVAPRKYQALVAWLKDKDIEGLVFHHPDGRMAKIKKRDFGLDR